MSNISEPKSQEPINRAIAALSLAAIHAGPHGMAHYDIAKAVLLAALRELREPSEDMVEAGAQIILCGGDWPSSTEVWRAMIDALIGDKP